MKNNNQNKNSSTAMNNKNNQRKPLDQTDTVFGWKKSDKPTFHLWSPLKEQRSKRVKPFPMEYVIKIPIQLFPVSFRAQTPR